MSTTTLMSVEQFAQLPDDERGKYELVEGELVSVSGPIRRGKAVQILQSNDTLESPELLPGFSAKVAEIFEEL